MINLWFSNGKFFVWNVEDVFVLRKQHRVVGSLVGHYPIKPFQVQKKWLPLKLMPEEARLMIDNGYAQMMSIPEKIEDPAVIEAFYTTRDKLCEEQVVLLKENRKQEILEKADVIYEGKKKKFMEGLEKKKRAKQSMSTQPQHYTDVTANEKSNSAEPPARTDCKPDSSTPHIRTDSNLESAETDEFPATKEEMIEAMFAKIPDVDKELCMVQLFTECPWKTSNPIENWKYPYTQAEKLRYAVFKDLWEKGYYVTSAMKFGGDFLAYEGDPLKFHALFIVVCLDSAQRFRGHDLVVYGRLGQNVKKTVSLASLNEAGEVDYISINWNHEML